MSEEDLFGSDSSEEEEVDEEMKKKMEAARAKIEKKAKEAKSMIVYELSPVDGEVNLEDVAKECKSLVMDGLSWGEGHKIKPFIFGMYKLSVVATIVDSKIETSLLEDKMTELEGVKRVDVADWQKL